jgi:hypothetical protein
MPSNLDPLKVQAVISFDEQTVADTTTQNERNHRTQESIKNATWWAFGAVAAYAVVTTFMWCAMIEQNKIAARALQQTTENFRTDERAWVELDPIRPELLKPADNTFSATFECNIFPKNVGKTPALDIEARATDTMAVDGWDENADNVARAQDMLYTALGPEVFHNHVPRVLAPNSVSPVPFRLTCEAAKPFPNGHAETHYLIGKFNYCDKFSVRHWLRFCYYVVNARGEIWACKNGNDEDRNGETPTPETACVKPN